MARRIEPTSGVVVPSHQLSPQPSSVRLSAGAFTALKNGIRKEFHGGSCCLTALYIIPGWILCILVITNNVCIYQSSGLTCATPPSSNIGDDLNAILAQAESDDNPAYTHNYTKGFLACLIIFCFCYVVYLIEAFFFSRTKIFVSNRMNLVNAEEYLQSLYRTIPSVYENVECYHMVTRTRHVKTRNSDGSYTTRTETYTEKVVTHRASTQYKSYTSCKDVTIHPDITSFTLTKLTLAKEFCFADLTSQADYDTFKNAFHERHAHCDTFRSFSTEMNLDGYQEVVLAYQQLQLVPWSVRHARLVYYLMSLCGLSWFYRVWLSGVSHHERTSIKKQFKKG